MAAYNDRLYPPQFLTTVMPGFVFSTGCQINFSISANERSSISQIHVTVTSQKNNMSVLNKEKYQSYNMMKVVTQIFEEEDTTKEDRYYIILTQDDIQGKFQPNTYYKVQIRFSDINISSGSDIYNQNNQSHFSEWSTVCLIRGMTTEPALVLTAFKDGSNTTTLSSTDLYLHGYIQFAEGDQQSLQSYTIQLYDDSGNLIEEGEEKTNKYYNSDNINYRFKSQLRENIQYTLRIQITTNFYYSYIEPKEYYFEVVEPDYSSSFKGQIEYFPNPKIGCIDVRLYSKDGSSNLINFEIRRTSSQSNFKIWDIVHASAWEFTTALDYTWQDFTVKSGVFYKYIAYFLNSNMQRQGLTPDKDPEIIVFNDIFLLSNNKQLCIKFNPQIASYNYNVAEGKIDTIGSQYPYFRRNGAIYYRQFPLTGTISHFMDIEGNTMQASRKDIYKDTENLYKLYNYNNNITPYEDIIYERQFRQKVIEFLYENNVKLFKSTTQGNILVKLSDISFTPNQTLGRMIYDFSCTCYEIAEATYDKIRQIGNIVTIKDDKKSQLKTYEEIYGQIIRPDPSFSYVNDKIYFSPNINIKDILQDKYDGLGINAKDTYQKVILDSFTYIRIEMLEKPYLINMDTMQIIKTQKEDEEFDEDITTNLIDNAVLGYLIEINGQKVFINPEGKYEISDSNLDSNSLKAFKIESISFLKRTQAIIDYKLRYSLEENVSKLPISISTKQVIGQLFGTFNINDSVYRQIYKKYYYKKMYKNSRSIQEIQQLSNVWGLRIIGRPGLAFAIKDTILDDEEQITYLNETGLLEFYDTETSIAIFKFLGYHLDQVKLQGTLDQKEKQRKYILSGKKPLKKTQYFKTEIPVTNLETCKYKVQGVVVKYRGSQYYIYYDNNWFPIDLTNNIVKVPRIEAMVDYYAEIIIKEYKQQ